MRFTTLALAAMGIAVPFSVANAQQAPQGYGPPQGYEQGPPPGYNQGPPPGYDQQQSYGQDRHAMRRVLSPELRAMLKEQILSQGGADRSQARQMFHQQMQQLAAMNPQRQAEARNELQAQWNALPPVQKQQIEQRIAERHEQRDRQQGNDQYGPQRPGPYDPQQAGPQQYGPQSPAPHDNSGDDGDDE